MDELFNKGHSAVAFPLKLVFMPVDTALQFPAQAMFVAPKRAFKLSPDRNKLKRRMREAYRLNKQNFYFSLNEQRMLLAFIYTGKKIEDYNVIEKALKKLLLRAVPK